MASVSISAASWFMVPSLLRNIVPGIHQSGNRKEEPLRQIPGSVFIMGHALRRGNIFKRERRQTRARYLERPGASEDQFVHDRWWLSTSRYAGRARRIHFAGIRGRVP